MEMVSLIQREFEPQDAAFREAARLGAVIFKAPDGGHVVVGQSSFGGAWYGIVHHVAWESLYLGALLSAADGWRAACQLESLVVLVEQPMQFQKLKQAGWAAGQTLAATVMLKPAPRQGVGVTLSGKEPGNESTRVASKSPVTEVAQESPPAARRRVHRRKARPEVSQVEPTAEGVAEERAGVESGGERASGAGGRFVGGFAPPGRDESAAGSEEE